MTQYKMVVLDMDDTLMNSDNKLSIETKSYLLDIQKRGYYGWPQVDQQKVCYLLRELELINITASLLVIMEVKL